MNRYLPEGMLMDTEENRFYTGSEAGLLYAYENHATVEAIPTLCDSEYSLHFRFGGVRGVMPRSEVLYTRPGEVIKDIAVLTRVGKPVSFRIIAIERGKDGALTAVLSRRAVQEECWENYIDTLAPGDIIPGTVTHLETFGAFLDIGCGVISLLSIDTMSVSRISHPRDRLSVGDRLRVTVRSIDSLGRIYVSLRELLGTWEENAACFSVGDTVLGVVRSVENYGIFIELSPNLAGLAEPHEEVEPGDVAAVYIKSILPDKMKVKLVIIDTERRRIRPTPLQYFVAEEITHIDRFRYSPEGARKLVETVFS